ncbi:formyltransferase family protein [Streptomyces sp. M19]
MAVVTRPDAPSGRGRRLTAGPSRSAPRRRASRCSSRTGRGTRTSWRGCARSPGLLPGRRLRALLPRPALDIPAHGWVNLHFSLLPAWRAPPRTARGARGDEMTGASTFQIEEGWTPARCTGGHRGGAADRHQR